MQGTKILDLSRVLAGPWAVQQLADQGADVIKVEPPSGDDTRQFGPFVGDHSSYYFACNRNKRSITLNLREGTDQNIFRKLLDWADVVVENFRPHKLSKLNIDIPKILEHQPALVWVSIRGFGEVSPEWTTRPGYDLVLQHAGGATALTGSPDSPPLKHGNSTADLTTGFNVIQAILLGLLHQQRTGDGQQIIVNMLQTQAACLTYHATRVFMTGQTPEKRANSHAGLVPYDLYPCADGWVCIAVGQDRMWHALTQALDLPQHEHWSTNRDRLTHRNDVDAAVRNATRKWSMHDLCDHLASFDIPSGPVLSPRQTLAHPAVDTISVDHQELGPIELVGPSLTTTTTRALHAPPPNQDQHRDEILRMLVCREED